MDADTKRMVIRFEGKGSEWSQWEAAKRYIESKGYTLLDGKPELGDIHLAAGYDNAVEMVLDHDYPLVAYYNDGDDGDGASLRIIQINTL